MRCPGCGERIESHHQHCPSCGMPLPPARRMWRGSGHGIPVIHYQPAPCGPPIIPDRPPLILRSHPGPAPARGRRQITTRSWPAPPVAAPAASRTRPVRRARLLTMLGVSALLALLAWRASTPGALHFPLLATRSTAQGSTCPVLPLRSGTAHALTEATLASALRDAAHQDYRPATLTSTFPAGQPAYLTFRIASTSAGTATVLFCAPGASVRGELAVPDHAAGRYAQFSATFAAANAGRGVAVLRWNGQVTAALPFTIAAPAQP